MGLVVPISKTRGQEIRGSSELSLKILESETIPSSRLRIQVAKEARKNKVLKKGHRTIEVTWPIQKNLKRKHLEKECRKLLDRKMMKLSDEGLFSYYEELK